MQFRIGASIGFYLDENGVERQCLIYRLGGEEVVVDVETEQELHPPPDYYKEQLE